MKEKKNFWLIVCIVIIVILVGIIVGMSFNQNNINNNENSPTEQESNNNKNETNTDKEDENKELDSSSDLQTEHIMMEGMLEEIKTMKYTSSLGYSIRYDIDMFKIAKENDKDKYTTNNNEVYIIIEVTNTPFESYQSLTNAKTTNFNGLKVIEVDNTNDLTFGQTGSKIDLTYYVQGNNKTFIIKPIYPYDAGYIEGYGTRIRAMFETIEIN